MLGALVFSDETARKRLESIMLPLILNKCAERIEQARIEGFACAVLDAPTLIESGAHKMVDEIWLVCVPLEQQIERLMLRGGLSREEALLRIQSQMPLEEKMKYAHATIDNSGSVAHTYAQVDALWHARFP
jgi:dephospho-CoA kinase